MTSFDHVARAEQLLESPMVDPSDGRPIYATQALAHAVLALIETLQSIPMLAMQLNTQPEEEEGTE